MFFAHPPPPLREPSEASHLHIFNLTLNLIMKSTKCNVENILWKLRSWDSVEKFWASRALVGRFSGGGALLYLPSEPGGQLPSGGGCSLQKCHCTEELMLNFKFKLNKQSFWQNNPFVGEILVQCGRHLWDFNHTSVHQPKLKCGF